MLAILLVVVAVAACGGSDEYIPIDAAVLVDGQPIDGVTADGPEVDAALVDAALVDAPVLDAATDARVIDAIAIDAAPFAASDHQTARATGYLSSPQGFYEYLPPGYAASGPGKPLLIFFHGLGENGDGSLGALPVVLNNGPPRFINRDAWPESRPFIVLSPQQPSSCPNAASIAAFLTWARAHYNVDSTRIYLTGLSCGAIGIASYLQANVLTSDVAAVVGISGDWRGAWNTRMCTLGRMPIWALHGDADTNGGTLPDFSRLPITSLIACPQPPRADAVLTMLPGVGHEGRAWNDTYSGANGNDVYGWLLAHTR